MFEYIDNDDDVRFFKPTRLVIYIFFIALTHWNTKTQVDMLLYFILILSLPANINFKGFGFTEPKFKHAICRTGSEHTNYYTISTVLMWRNNLNHHYAFIYIMFLDVTITNLYYSI